MKPIFSHTLQPGQGFLFRETGNEIFHKVTGIEVEEGISEGFRDILGFDIEVLK